MEKILTNAVPCSQMVVDPVATVVAGDRKLLRREAGLDLTVQNNGPMVEIAPLEENGDRELFWWYHKKKKSKWGGRQKRVQMRFATIECCS
jgi:hypothetical protein